MVSCMSQLGSIANIEFSRVDLHPTTSNIEDLDVDDAESEASPHNAQSLPPNDALNAETTRHNRRSRILHIGRMRHATPDERIEALRRLRNENRDRATNENIEEGGWSVGERTLNRISARLGRAFGGARPASGISAPASRPVSQAPAASATTEGPSVVEAHPPTELNVTTMQSPPATTTEAVAEPSAPESDPQRRSSSGGR